MKSANKERVKMYNKFSRDKTENDNLNWETIKKENEITIFAISSRTRATTK